MYDYYDYMYHHGIKGMRWGIRRFQPYPKGKFGKFIGEKKKERKIKRLSKRAARTYYLKEQARTNYLKSQAKNNKSYKTYKTFDKMLKDQEANLTKKQVRKGRHSVARFRAIDNAVTAASSIAFAGLNAYIDIANGFFVNPLPIAVGAAGFALSAKDGYDYLKKMNLYKERKDRKSKDK